MHTFSGFVYDIKNLSCNRGQTSLFSELSEKAMTVKKNERKQKTKRANDYSLFRFLYSVLGIKYAHTRMQGVGEQTVMATKGLVRTHAQTHTRRQHEALRDAQNVHTHIRYKCTLAETQKN